MYLKKSPCNTVRIIDILLFSYFSDSETKSKYCIRRNDVITTGNSIFVEWSFTRLHSYNLSQQRIDKQSTR